MQMTAAALWLNSSFAGFDEAVTVFIHKLYDVGHVFFTPFMEIVSVLGKGGIFLILLSLPVVYYTFSRKKA